MKLLNAISVCLLLLFMIVVPPAFADAPKLDLNADYQKITQTLTDLLQARDTNQLPEGIRSAEQLQQTITGLQYQKYVVESGKGITECRNTTSRPIAVYGPTSKKLKSQTSQFDNTLYLLPSGEETDDSWNCEGLFLPSDVKAGGLDLGTASAVKFLSGTRLTISENPDTGAIEFNLPPTQVFKAGEVNWDIPDVAEADLSPTLPKAPLD